LVSYTWGRTKIDGVYENRALRRIFRPEREKVAGSWRRLHNEEHHNLNDSPNIIRVIKAGWTRCVGQGGNQKCIQKFGGEKMKRKDHSEGLGVCARIILERILKKEGGRVWTGFIWFRRETSGGFL
jgi:hypothetical protein